VECPTSVESIAASSNDALRLYRGVTCTAGALIIGEEVSDLSPLSQLRRAGSLDFRGNGGALAALTALVRIDASATIRPATTRQRQRSRPWAGSAATCAWSS
jgi:hypothetical protein